MQGLLNRQIPSDSRLVQVEAVQRRPIMFYR